jgi:hypothetical protein
MAKQKQQNSGIAGDYFIAMELERNGYSALPALRNKGSVAWNQWNLPSNKKEEYRN